MITIQKLIPLIILNYFNINFRNKLFIFLLIIGIYSGIQGLKFNSLKLILTYSSIVQVIWLIILIINREIFILNYFIIYTFINFCLIQGFYIFNIKNLRDIIYLKLNNKNNFYFFMIIIISLRRLPPFFGFLLKWISIYIILNINFYLIILLVINSLIRINFYFKIMFNSILNFLLVKKKNLKFLNYKIKFNIKYLNYYIYIYIYLIIYELF